MRSRVTVPAIALAFLATPLLGQTTQTFHACYVPDVGAMYLIQLPGLPSQCLSTGHQQVSWSEGGDSVLSDGSVTTPKIADGAVTAAKLASGSVTTAHLADDAVGTSKIQDAAVTATKLGADIPLPPASCSIDQIIRWNGSAWVCAGETGVSSVEVVTTVHVVTRSATTVYTETYLSSCPAGKKVLGGGYEGRVDTGSGFQDGWSSAPPVHVVSSSPDGDSGWALRYWIDFSGNARAYELTVEAICATVG